MDQVSVLCSAATVMILPSGAGRILKGMPWNKEGNFYEAWQGKHAVVGKEIRMEKKVHILGFAGSLRKASFNRSLLGAALELVPKDASLEIFDLEGIPPFNQDEEDHPSERVKEFKARIKAADAILIATPE